MKFKNQEFYNCIIQLDNNEIYSVNANWIHNNNLDYWQDWECDAGYARLNIEHDFSVQGGECANDYLGNLLTGWKLLSKPTVCKQKRCNGCTDDLLVYKRQTK